jgi:murein DD-endopeptidase MepM/ murein hydrolase activator NlpD
VLPRRLLVVVVASALGVGAFLGPATAGPDSDPSTAGELQEAIGEASEAEVAALAELEAVRSRRQELEAQAAALDVQIADARSRQRVAEREVERITAEVVAVQAEVDRIQGLLDAAHNDFVDSVATMYQNAGGGSPLELLAEVDDTRELIAGNRYLRVSSDLADKQIEEYSAFKDDLKTAKEQLVEEQTNATSARDAVAAEAQNVTDLRAQLEPARAAAAEEERNENAVLAEIQSRKAEFEQEYAELLAASNAVSNLGSRGNGTGSLGWPCNGGVASPFGNRLHPIYGTYRQHTGVDLSCSNGAPIAAAGSGVVIQAGWNGGYGNAVMIDHGNGLATLYGHQSSIAVSNGESVTRGETIGYVGSTGASTGPHLHFETRVNGTPVNPCPYIGC